MNCPFCEEFIYEKMGLWAHLSAYPCPEYEKAGEDYRAFRAELAIQDAAIRGEK